MAAVWLVGWRPKSENLIIPYGVSVLLAHIAGITLNSVYDTVLDFLHDPHMVGITVLSIFIVPVKEDDIPRPRFMVSVLPQAPILEPLDTGATPGKLGNNTGVDIPALISTPTDKAGAPLHAGAKAIPRPVRLTAHIAKLGERYRDDLAVTSADTIKNRAPHTAVALCQQFGKLLALVSIKLEVVCHLIGGLVSYMDIKRCPVGGGRGLDDMAVPIVCFRYHGVRSSFRPG